MIFSERGGRHLAKSLAASVRKYVNEMKVHSLVFATCHDDFIPWLQPDWVFSTQTKELAILCESDVPEVVVTIVIHSGEVRKKGVSEANDTVKFHRSAKNQI